MKRSPAATVRPRIFDKLPTTRNPTNKSIYYGIRNSFDSAKGSIFSRCFVGKRSDLSSEDEFTRKLVKFDVFFYI